MTSRFEGGEALLAGFYRLLFPGAQPHEVDVLRPRQVAAVLGRDLIDAVRPVPAGDVPVPMPNRAQRRATGPRLRKVIER